MFGFCLYYRAGVAGVSHAGVPRLLKLKVLPWEICHKACVNVFWFCRLLNCFFLSISFFKDNLTLLFYTVIVVKHLSLPALRILYSLQLQSSLILWGCFPVGGCSFHESFTPRC